MRMLSRRLSSVLAALTLAACSSTPEAPAAPKARGEAAGVKVSATVESVDVPGRRITLKGPKGNVETYLVGEEVRRMGEIKVGDRVTADYKVAAIAELREPTADEKGAPLVMAQGADRAPSDQPPGAAFARAVRRVARIESVDAAARTFSIRGPLDGLLQLRVDDAAAFAALKAGQPVVVVFAESLLLAVEPGPK
jgi:Cu/Ag efflux protein CusF